MQFGSKEKPSLSVSPDDAIAETSRNLDQLNQRNPDTRDHSSDAAHEPDLIEDDSSTDVKSDVPSVGKAEDTRPRGQRKKKD